MKKRELKPIGQDLAKSRVLSWCISHDMKQFFDALWNRLEYVNFNGTDRRKYYPYKRERIA